MAGKKNQIQWKDEKCPVCRTLFIPAPQHIYKDKRSPYKRVCSWGCVCKSERLKEEAKAAKAGGKK